MRKYLLPTLLILAGLTAYGIAQTAVNPKYGAMVCAYNSSPPTATSGTFILAQCNSSGQLVLH